MKKIIRILLMFFISLPAIAQQGSIHTYGFAGYNEGMKVVRHTNGFLLAGNSSEATGNNKLYLVKTDKQGKPQWDHHFFRFGLSRINDLMLISPDSILVAGTMLKNPARGYDFFVALLDTLGNEYWRRIYGNKEWNEIRSIGGHSGNIWLTGYSVLENTFIRQTYVGKLSLNGHIKKSFHLNDSTANSMNDISLIGDTLLLLAGYSQHPIHSNKRGRLMIRDTSFIPVADTILSDTNTSELICSQWLDPYLIAGGYRMEASKSKQAWNVSIEWNGSWRKSATYGKSGDDVFYEVAVNANGKPIFAGFTESYGSGGRDILYGKYNPKGYWLSSSNKGGIKDESAHSIVSGDSLGFAIAGTTQSWGNFYSDIFLLLADSISQDADYQGHYTHTQNKRIDKENLSLSPNPFSSQLHYEFDLAGLKYQSMVIRDTHGKTVFQSHSQQKQTINLSHLQAGFYIFTIYTKRGSVSRKIIKVD